MKRYQPDLDLRKAHDVRRIEGCGCGGVGFRDQMVKIDGGWWHGRCAIDKFGLDRVATLPRKAYGGLRRDDIGDDAMRVLINTTT